MARSRSRKRGKKRRGRKSRMSPVTKKQVVKVINSLAERGFGINIINATPNTVTSFQNLTVISRGTGTNQRTGNQIRGTSIDFKGRVFRVDATNVVRVICFRWKYDTANATPIREDFFGAAPAADDFYTRRIESTNPVWGDRRRRYEILFDKTWYLDPNTASVPFNITVNLKNKLITFVDSTATTAMGHIYLAFSSDSSMTNHPGWNCISKVRWTDF